jgi:antirestriction protein
MRIYVASLSDYNAGVLHGRWIDVTDLDTIWEGINEMLAESPTAKREGMPAEEWAVHDYEGFGPVKLSEQPDFEKLVAIAEAHEEHGDIYLHWVAHDTHRNTDPKWFQDQYRGEYDSLGDYAYEWWTEVCEWKEADEWWHPSHFVDWQRMGEALETSGDIYTIEEDCKVYVFDNN